MKNLRLTVLALSALVSAHAAQAATSTAEIVVTGQVAAACILTALPLNFGIIGTSVSTTPVTATTTVSVICTPGAAITLALDGGLHLSGSQRHIKNGTTLIKYNLFQPNSTNTGESAGPIQWGDASALGSTYQTSASGIIQNLVVYGQIPAQSTTLAAGGYADVVTVTLTY